MCSTPLCKQGAVSNDIGCDTRTSHGVENGTYSLWQNEDLFLIPPKNDLGSWVSPFCRAKFDFWGPRPLQNEDPATNLARGFLYKIRVPNPFFLVHVCDFHNHWPLQNGKPGMSKHLSRITTWKKENRQKYKDPFCRGMM